MSRREFFRPRLSRVEWQEPYFMDDVEYRMFLRLKLQRHVELAQEDERRSERAQKG